jgi:ubiquinone/menaquinone biosynthesis C-methylase UbiE
MIENVLRTHPGVRETGVASDGRDGLVAFVVPDDAYLDDVLGRATASASVLGKWRKACDLSQLTKEAATAPVGFNTIGWDSSYTRQPIPLEDMREWVETTVADVLQLAPRAAYEIGCGSGMLVMRIAPHCDRYVAADFSPVVLERVRKQLQTEPSVAQRVELLERRADNFDGLAENSFDVAVLNSVVQYFPSLSYLTKVLEKAINIVRPGGHVYVGDLRSLPLLPAFASSVELFHAADALSVGELRDRIERRIQHDRELVISPSYFMELQRRLPKVSRVEIQLRRGRADNEMTRYRYNAILNVGQGTQAPFKLEFQDWTGRELTLDDIRSEFLRHPHRPVGFKGIQNARIEEDLAALVFLRDADATLTAGELRRELEQKTARGLHPQDLFDLDAGSGFKVFLSWAACRPDGSYDAVFIPARSLQGETLPAIAWPEPDASGFVRLANAPGQDKLRKGLIDQLVAHCRQSLPQERIPLEVVLVDTVMRTADGKVDPDAVAVTKLRSRTGWWIKAI